MISNCCKHIDKILLQSLVSDSKQALMAFAHKQSRNLNNTVVRREVFTLSDGFWKQLEIYNRLKEAKEIMRTNQSPSIAPLTNHARNQHSVQICYQKTSLSFIVLHTNWTLYAETRVIN